MLVALKDNDERVYADECEKKDDDGNKINYFCPECGSPLVLRKGTKNIHHFAHENSDDKSCVFLRLGGGESITHDSMKRHIKDIIERDNFCLVSELEYRIPEINRIADYYCELRDKWGNLRKIAVECVHRHTDIDEFLNKNEDYAKVGIHTLWLFNADKFIAGYYYDETTSITNHTYWKSEVRIQEIMKEAAKLYYSKIFTLNLNDSSIWAIHLDPVKREVEGKEVIDWDSFYEDRECDGWVDIEDYKTTVGGYERTLKSTKSPNVKWIPEFKLTSFQIRDADEWADFNRAVAQPFIKPWWKATA